jgi:ABC-type transport system involved in cytochrome bd biosynthesis fused ATPase/permease subunit
MGGSLGYIATGALVVVFIAIAMFLTRVRAAKRARLEAEAEAERARLEAKAADAARTFAEWRAKAVGVANPDGTIMVAVKEESPSHVIVNVGVDEKDEA